MAERAGEQTAIVDYDQKKEYSYTDLKVRSRKVAQFLIEKVKVCPGDRVALCARNGPWSLELFYAMPIIGAILTTYNCLLREQELLDSVIFEAPKVIFYEECYYEKVQVFQKALPETTLVTLDGNVCPGGWTYNDLLMMTEWDGPWADLTLRDICMLLHTGGTTGAPKAAKISYRAMILNTIGQIIDYSIGETDIVYVSFPFFHTAAWNAALPVLLCGGKIYLKRKFDPEGTLRMVEEEKLTTLAGSPSIFRRLCHCADFNSTSFSSVKRIRCGSATPTIDLIKKYWEKGSWILFYNGYGMTESGSGILSLPASTMTRELAHQKAGSVGKPMIFVQVRIVDEEGKDLPVGCEGELLVQSGNMFSGYWKKPEASRKAIQDGWLHTGDIARCDEDGFYYICGRKKNMYISGGENIYPTEIETFLLNHPAVADAYVFEVPDDDWGEVGKAIVVIQPDMTLTRAELSGYLSQNLSSIKRPKYIQFVNEVPRNEAGKIIGNTIDQLYRFPGEE